MAPSKTEILAVHHVDRVDRLLDFPEHWHIWETANPIGYTYRDLSMWAVDEGWGHEWIVVQDDVRFTDDFYEYDRANPEDFPIIAYGQTKEPGHVCPRAFSASPEGWKALEDVWLPAPNTLCQGFTLALQETGGIVKDWTVHLGG